MSKPQFVVPVLLAVSVPLSAQEPIRTLAMRVDSIVAAQVQAGDPGCAIGVFWHGELVLSRGYGFANVESGERIAPQTTFNLGSASKPFTALAILTLEERRQLSLDDDVRRYVPELPVYDAPIRIRDLLQHTSGLRDYEAMGVLAGRDVTTLQEFADLLAAQRSVNFTPGTRHEYSHSDFGLLALVIERVVGEPFGAYLEREVLSPLGMTSSRVHDTRGANISHRAFGHERVGGGFRVLFPNSRLPGPDNLYSSVEDFQRWDHALAEAVAGRRSLVARLLQRPTLPNGDTIPYAFGIRRSITRGLTVFSRGGHSNGMRVEFTRFPDQHFGMATLCNTPQFWPGELSDRVAAEILSDVVQPVASTAAAPPAVAVPLSELQQYVGTYAMATGHETNEYTPTGLTEFAVVNGRLAEVLLGGDTTQAMTYHGGGRFTYEGSPAAFQVRFVKAAAGAPVRAEFSWNGDIRSVMERLDDAAVWRPDSAELAQYAGTYHSPELEANWEIVSSDHRLWVRRRGMRDLSLTAVRPNLFERPFGSWDSLIPTRLEFARDASGAVTHLVVSTSGDGQAVRDLRFVRLSPEL